jgi:uncharacterized protein
MQGEEGRLAWRCRRGMKELDLVLTRYLRERWPTASQAQRQQFERVLELPDPELAAYLMGRENPPDAELLRMVDALRGSASQADGWRIRTATIADHPRILALNEEFVRFLAPLAQARLTELHAKATLALVIENGGEAAAFLLAFREGIDYDSINYRWFAQRYPAFLYIDRVVVGSGLQGQGAGTALYEHVFAQARAAAVPWITCEIDCEPPNPASGRFHARLGFAEIGRQPVPGGKQVSLQVAAATPVRAAWTAKSDPA